MNINYIKSKIASEQSKRLDFNEELKFCVVGVGGAGSNTVNRIKRMQIGDVFTIAINTDLNHLNTIDADKKVQLSGYLKQTWGTGGDVEMGERAILIAQDTLKDVFKGFDVVFVIAGFGGGTGTGATPIIAHMAKKSGALVVSIITIPFTIEKARVRKAYIGLKNLIKSSQTVIVLENDKLLEHLPNFPIDKAFYVMDQLIGETVKAFYIMLSQKSVMNINFSEVKRLFSTGKLSTILFNEGTVNNIPELINELFQNPLLEIDYSSSTEALVYINTGEELSLSVVMGIIDDVGNRLKHRENVIWGMNVDPSLNENVKLLCILTNINLPFLDKKEEIVKKDDLFGIDIS